MHISQTKKQSTNPTYTINIVSEMLIYWPLGTILAPLTLWTEALGKVNAWDCRKKAT